ncbi:hypothetical protein R3I94_004901 [Phoxinus phoxinus]|uniref:Claudin n=1 Tax=Phoxinus phoxinus TaxID=58324 RepID=A0AAN9DBT4_9TELE
MANAGLQLLGYILASLGLLGLIASTAMAEWKISSYAGDNIITAQAMYEGLWQSCVSQSTGQLQCKVYDSLLQIPGEVQGTRALMILATFLCGIGLLIAAVGMKCTTCLSDNKEQKNKVAVAGGVLFVIADMLLLYSLQKLLMCAIAQLNEVNKVMKLLKGSYYAFPLFQL